MNDHIVVAINSSKTVINMRKNKRGRGILVINLSFKLDGQDVEEMGDKK